MSALLILFYKRRTLPQNPFSEFPKQHVYLRH